MILHETKLFTLNRTATKQTPLQPSGIVVHSTGVNQKKISAYWWQFNTTTISASVHGFIGLNDAGELCYQQTLPYTHACWGCGSGKNGSYNASHIQFEICEDVNDAAWTRQTYDAAIEICAELCRQFNISPARVVSHVEANRLGFASAHADTEHWWGKYGLTMDAFRAELKNRLEDNSLKRYKTIFDVPSSLQPETKQLIASGALKGRGDGVLDVSDDMLRAMIVCKRYVDAKLPDDIKLSSGLLTDD